MNDAYLILENGAAFKGKSFGYYGEAIGELVFSTGMTGYLETLSDPLYYGQIVLQTFPLIGNYGVIPPDFGTGPVHPKAYIVREWCQDPSNFRSEGNLDTFLRERKTPGLCGIDTRALTRIIRENGVMNAMISKTPELSDEQWAQLRGYRISGAVGAVFLQSGTQDVKCRICGGGAGARHNVLLWDFGNASRFAGDLAGYGCDSTIVRYDTAADDVLSLNPDGILLSGGPGDPVENTSIIGEIKKLLDKDIPLLGIGLGHQMLALARGIKTIKLRFGHRGSNQTVAECETGRVSVTSQNHGYAVALDSLPTSAELSYVNANDGTCEGLLYKDIPAFSVQFSPTDDVFAKFFTYMR